MSDERFLVVGLGNPGPKYAATRHNAGQLVLDELAGRMGGRFKAHKGVAELVEGRLGAIPVILMKPTSFMNTSGGPISAVSKFFKTDLEHLVVIHDELDLPLGVLRLKRGGGEGGHNGLRSTTASLGSPDYARVRVGISRPPGRQDPADYVLREFSVADRKELPFVLDRAADAVEVLVRDGLTAAQNEFNA